METLRNTNFKLPGQTNFYKGKVRDVYTINNNKLVMVISDRISAFDVVLPAGIPYKGQVLNQIAVKFLEATKDIVPNWLEASPDPNVAIGKMCAPIAVEMVIRGYLAGHAAREYNSGKRTLCGVTLPEGLKENDKLPQAIITPTTKAAVGHDEDISRGEILKRGIVSETDYKKMEDITHKLFERGTKLAAERGLILVDTKFEFGKIGSTIYLMDEILTPDSSRYFYADGYAERQKKGEPQKQLSKEFVRQWLITNNFQGKEGQVVPEMTEEIVNGISERYIELYENITGEKFVKSKQDDILNRVHTAILDYLSVN
ncbi:MAG TPA: phosphoribosylaminoimidazolesuccinocarboxamide synthase [Flavobacteriales bacterium]|nr:phosphoribosylaminoimidazolesuccinocarboxamide synthase [Flavobacteriales bacterium]